MFVLKFSSSLFIVLVSTEEVIVLTVLPRPAGTTPTRPAGTTPVGPEVVGCLGPSVVESKTTRHNKTR